jgi:hypothetical protein
MRYTSSPIRYTELPPRIRLIYSEEESKPPVQRYLEKLDGALEVSSPSSAVGQDLLSLVFAQQTRTQQIASRQLAHLLTERTGLAQRHTQQLNEWIEQLASFRPPRNTYWARRMPDKQQLDLEKQIQDLERQKRDIEVNLWRDSLELRRELVTQRQAYHQTNSRRAILEDNVHG